MFLWNFAENSLAGD